MGTTMLVSDEWALKLGKALKDAAVCDGITFQTKEGERFKATVIDVVLEGEDPANVQVTIQKVGK